MRTYQLQRPPCKFLLDTRQYMYVLKPTYSNRSTASCKPTATVGSSTNSSPRLSSTLTPPKIQPRVTTPSILFLFPCSHLPFETNPSYSIDIKSCWYTDPARKDLGCKMWEYVCLFTIYFTLARGIDGADAMRQSSGLPGQRTTCTSIQCRCKVVHERL